MRTISESGQEKENIKMPLVSVVMTVYNNADTLKQSVDSVLAQTWQNMEIILVDDCSADGTMELIEKEYGEVSHINIVYVRNDRQIGMSASANAGIAYAGGEYVAFLSGEDVWMPDKLERQMDLFGRCSQSVGAVYSRYCLQENQDATWPLQNMQTAWKSGYIFYRLLLTSLVGMSTLVVRRDVLVELGGFNEQLAALENYELTIRIAEKYAILLVDEVLTAVREEGGHGRTTPGRDKIAAQCYIMNLFLDALQLAELKEQKFESVYQEACLYDCGDFFLQCVTQLFRDKDYLAYAQAKWDKRHPSSHPESPQTVDISGVKACTGCMACYNVCPVGAITRIYSEEGFIVPVIDREKCTKCGRCKSVCPVCNETAGVMPPEECYAVVGEERVRMESSSGGVFRILADAVLAEGGYVAGAVWNKDWQVAHILSPCAEDVERMMSSKYVQSDMGDVYRRTEAVLRQGKRVLFTGCACQIAGLKRYLGKDYENLMTADVVCHGVPSPGVFASRLERVEDLRDVSFRRKKEFGWGVGLYLRYADGTEERGQRGDPYMTVFLKNWALREACYDCRFKNKKYSDLTLGDFWGISRLGGPDDGWGTSFVTVNTVRGARILKELLPRFKQIVSLQTKAAVPYNRCIEESVKKSEFRTLFYEEWKNRGGRTLEQIVRQTKEKARFDLAIVCMWSLNYGNAMTNYALHTFLKSQGLRIVMLDNYCPLKPERQFLEFARAHYTLSSDYFVDYDREMLNDCCVGFLVASDQTWHYGYSKIYHYGDYFMLDFVEEHKKKVSYAASFGNVAGAPSEAIGRKYYKRFQAISVREEFGVALCRDRYGVEATCVADPVFLLDAQAYDELLAQTPVMEEEPYIAAYLLDPNEEKRRLCLQIQRELGGIKIVNMVDANLRNQDQCLRVLEYDNIKSGLKVEEWLSYIRHARYVITDSFHGTCFSLIFGKRFAAVKNRQSDRFDTFTAIPEIAGRILEGDQPYCVQDLAQDIDYEAVYQKLAPQIEASKQFVLEKIVSQRN